MNRDRSAVILLSGGQDSTTCLFWAADHLNLQKVLALSISYGQRHRVEIDATLQVLQVFRETFPEVELDHEVLDLGPVLSGTSPLTDHSLQVETYSGVSSLPGGLEATFVPGRNALFLVLAGNRAKVRGAGAIVTGTSQEDFGGYPDCRRSFIDQMEIALDEALSLHPGAEVIRLLTPLMDLSKAESVELAQSLPGAMEALAFSHTCYQGEVSPCGSCHSCLLRGKGFRAAGMEDPLVTRLKMEGRLDPSWSYPE